MPKRVYKLRSAEYGRSTGFRPFPLTHSRPEALCDDACAVEWQNAGDTKCG